MQRSTANVRLRAMAACAAMLVSAACCAAAGALRPTRNIEVIVGTPAGGPLDTTARLIQKFLEPRNGGNAVIAVNKPGGGHVIAMQYLNQHAGDAHYISMALQNLLTNRITGMHPLTYTDVTPLALLTSECIGMWVRAESPIKTGKDLIAQMVKSPEWQQALEVHQWEDEYLNSAGALKFMQQEYRQLETLLVELGEAKAR